MKTKPKPGDLFAYRGPQRGIMLFDEHVRYVGHDDRLVVVSFTRGKRGAAFAEVYPESLVPIVGRCVCDECCP